MNPFETPFDRLTSVEAPRKVRGPIWWADVAFFGCGAIGLIMIIAWRVM